MNWKMVSKRYMPRFVNVSHAAVDKPWSYVTTPPMKGARNDLHVVSQGLDLLIDPKIMTSICFRLRPLPVKKHLGLRQTATNIDLPVIFHLYSSKHRLSHTTWVSNKSTRNTTFRSKVGLLPHKLDVVGNHGTSHSFRFCALGGSGLVS